MELESSHYIDGMGNAHQRSSLHVDPRSISQVQQEPCEKRWYLHLRRNSLDLDRTMPALQRVLRLGAWKIDRSVVAGIISYL